MSVREYCQYQVKVIIRYARLRRVDENSACQIWIQSGLAEKFRIKHPTEE